MAILEADLLLIVGSEAYLEFSASEITAICAKFSAGQEPYCELFCFKLLAKKFRPSYRMGSTFEAESDKFKFYNQKALELSASVGAGRLGLPASEGVVDPSRNDIERQKWVEPTRR
jgi:hypothetical protein